MGPSCPAAGETAGVLCAVARASAAAAASAAASASADPSREHSGASASTSHPHSHPNSTYHSAVSQSGPEGTSPAPTAAALLVRSGAQGYLAALLGDGPSDEAGFYAAGALTEIAKVDPGAVEACGGFEACADALCDPQARERWRERERSYAEG